MEGKYLTIGSIVKLENSDELSYMLVGYFPKKENKMYDYLAVPFPFGLIDSDQFICFDKAAISSVVFDGYSDNKAVDILNGFEELANTIKNVEAE